MKDSARKAMFAKGKKQYAPFQMAKQAFREIAYEEKLTTPDEAMKWINNNKLPRGIPKRPDLVYSKSNILKNINAGVDVKKEVYY